MIDAPLDPALITADRLVADIATACPATIAVFQRHQIEFCCGGQIRLDEACERLGLDEATLLAALRRAARPDPEVRDWREASSASLVAHIQARYHEPLRAELPRLHAMLTRVLTRRGDRDGARLRALLDVFDALQRDLLAHMLREDTGLFPVLTTLDDEERVAEIPLSALVALETPLRALVAEHRATGLMLARIRSLTDDYVPPADACPTVRGLYYGLERLEAEMHVHVHLENHLLFPRMLAALQP